MKLGVGDDPRGPPSSPRMRTKPADNPLARFDQLAEAERQKRGNCGGPRRSASRGIRGRTPDISAAVEVGEGRHAGRVAGDLGGAEGTGGEECNEIANADTTPEGGRIIAALGVA